MDFESPKRVQPRQITAADIRQFDPLASPSPRKQRLPTRLSFQITIERHEKTGNQKTENIKIEKNGRFTIKHLSRSFQTEKVETPNSKTGFVISSLKDEAHDKPPQTAETNAFGSIHEDIPLPWTINKLKDQRAAIQNNCIINNGARDIADAIEIVY